MSYVSEATPSRDIVADALKVAIGDEDLGIFLSDDRSVSPASSSGKVSTATSGVVTSDYKTPSPWSQEQHVPASLAPPDAKMDYEVLSPWSQSSTTSMPDETLSPWSRDIPTANMASMSPRYTQSNQVNFLCNCKISYRKISKVTI